MRAVKSVSIDSERRVIITYLDGSTETLYPNCIWCDSEALRQLIKDLLEEKADAITQTIENVTVATFADGADEGVIKKLLVSIDPIQEGEGDPSPENVRPISGRTGVNAFKCGKNLVNIPNATSSGAGNIYPITPMDISIPVGTYTVSATSSASAAWQLTLRDSSNNIVGAFQSATFGVGRQSVTVTTTDIATRVSFYVNAATTITDIQLELGSTATDYEPYKGSTVTVNWETEAGTVYGGTLAIDEDGSCKLTVDSVLLSFNGSEPWVSTSLNTYLVLWNNPPSISNNDLAQISNYLIAGGAEYTKFGKYRTQTNGAIVIGNITNSQAPYTYKWETVEEFKAYLAEHPLQVCYKIATPTEIQLTPQEIRTLLGVNNIWADSGNILELVYTADTKLYIGEQQSSALGSNKQTGTKPDIQPVTDKTREETNEEVKEE